MSSSWTASISPATKPCGEFINLAGAQALARLGVLGVVEAHGPASIRGWDVHPQGLPSFRASFSRGVEGLGLPRALLPALLRRGSAGIPYAASALTGPSFTHGFIPSSMGSNS